MTSFYTIFAGISNYPQDLKQISSDLKTGSVTFGWKELECEQMNGVLYGYEVKLYYDDEKCTERVIESVTTYTILPQWETQHKCTLPTFISVAAINELGEGYHSPPVIINPPGQNNNMTMKTIFG